MIDTRPEHLFDIVSLEQTLYRYCNEIDSGASRIQDYFTEDCTFTVGQTTWRGRAGVRKHYDDDAESVKKLCKDGIKTVRHAMLNLRIEIQDDGSAVANLIFMNFSAGGTPPFFNGASPTVVADTRMVCKRGADGGWLIHEFLGTPLFFGDDPYINTVLRDV
jgi:ketosteroid isomerase-like protein